MSLEFSYEQVYDFFIDHFTGFKVNGNHFRARCPLCGDSKKSLSKKRFTLTYFNPEKIYWHCYNCDKGGKDFLSLYCALTGTTKIEAINKFRKFDSEKVKKILKPEERHIPIEEKSSKEISDFSYILNDCLSESDEPEGIKQKILKQKLLEFKIQRKIQNNLYVAYRGTFSNRIIIPVFESNKLLYFQGRAVSKEIDPKYLNPSFNKSSFIHNKENFDINKSIIVTEGLLDAMSIGNQGCCCFGASVSDEFLEQVFKLTRKNVIIALDNDKQGKISTLKIIKESSFKNKLLFFIMPEKYKEIKDMNELKVSELEDDLYSFIIQNSFELFQANILFNLLKNF